MRTPAAREPLRAISVTSEMSGGRTHTLALRFDRTGLARTHVAVTCDGTCDAQVVQKTGDHLFAETETADLSVVVE